MSKFIDITGGVYERLTVLSAVTPRTHPAKWLCKCECGTQIEVSGKNLKNGHTKSCGCLMRELSGAKNKLQVNTGDKFGRWSIVSEVFGSNDRKFNVVCECGNEKALTLSVLVNGKSKSCGCLRRELLKAKALHGATKIDADPLLYKTYYTWRAVLARCLNPKTKRFHNYGGRGIKVCDRWANSFDDFLIDMGKKPSLAHSIDRINNDGDYEPSNCKWSTIEEQGRNRRTNRTLTFNGKTMCVQDWSKAVGISSYSILSRLNRGWSIEEALTIPVMKFSAQNSQKDAPNELMRELLDLRDFRAKVLALEPVAW